MWIYILNEIADNTSQTILITQNPKSSPIILQIYFPEQYHSLVCRVQSSLLSKIVDCTMWFKRYEKNHIGLTRFSDVLREQIDKVSPENIGLKRATSATGCFWGVEEAFKQLRGVKKTEERYTGGWAKNPTYEQVCTDRTGSIVGAISRWFISSKSSSLVENSRIIKSIVQLSLHN